MIKVKVCGITTLADAEKALEFGADVLGFNFYPPSRRFIAPEAARAILLQLPAETCSTAVFVNAPPVTVRQIVTESNDSLERPAYSWLQFHGEETPEYCRGWGLKVIKAFRLKTKESLTALARYSADFYLLDSWSPGYGGSGTPFPWDWLEGLNSSNLILSGGLTVDNVGEAIRRGRPYGVDVCSGVELRPGIKDHAKLKDFIAAAKAA
jgi:phosphoribosylanthranilate isomerase